MGRRQCPLCWAELHRGSCPKGSCAQGAPGAAQDEPTLGCVHRTQSCRGLASDAAGSGISAVPQPAPLLVPGTLLAPRTGSLGDGTGHSRGTAGQPSCGCRHFAAGTGCVPESSAGESVRGPFGASRDAGHGPGVFHLCHVMIAVLQGLLFTGRGAAQLQAITVGAEPSELRARYHSPYQI